MDHHVVNLVRLVVRPFTGILITGIVQPMQKSNRILCAARAGARSEAPNPSRTFNSPFCARLRIPIRPRRGKSSLALGRFQKSWKSVQNRFFFHNSMAEIAKKRIDSQFPGVGIDPALVKSSKGPSYKTLFPCRLISFSSFPSSGGPSLSLS